MSPDKCPLPNRLETITGATFYKVLSLNLYQTKSPIFFSLWKARQINRLKSIAAIEMEATKEEIGFLDKIRPPRLEEAGLEDCALPPDSIKEAFLKAASAVSSRVASVLSSDGECVNDPLPGETSPHPADALVGSEDVGEASGPCAAEKGGALIEDGYRGADLVGSGIPEAKEDVIFPPPGEEKEGGDGKPCVDGVRGLTIGGEEEDDEGPTLVEGYLV